MKNSFRSFLTPSVDTMETAWASEKTVFIFDTNVLLNLYGFEEQTRTDFFSTVTKLSPKIFLPYHVGLEYNLRRLSVIRNEKKTFRELASIAEKLEDKLQKDLEQLKLSEKFPQVSEFSLQLRESIKTALAKFSDDIEPFNKVQPDVRSEDNILNLIDAFSDGCVGAAPADQEWLDNLYKEGVQRYADRIPPGFRDATKDKDSGSPTFIHNGLKYERQFGDLIIWKQILEEVAQSQIENVIFVTDDAKDDWWSSINSGGDKIIGPHEALRSEIYKIANVKLFHMYSTSDFLENAGRILKVEIMPRSIEDAIAKHINIESTPHYDEDGDGDGDTARTGEYDAVRGGDKFGGWERWWSTIDKSISPATAQILLYQEELRKAEKLRNANAFLYAKKVLSESAQARSLLDGVRFDPREGTSYLQSNAAIKAAQLMAELDSENYKLADGHIMEALRNQLRDSDLNPRSNPLENNPEDEEPIDN